MNASQPQPQDLVEHALASASTDGCVAIVDDAVSANLRWANNTLTTNGVTHERALTVIAVTSTADGIAYGSAAKTATSFADVEAIVHQAEQAANTARPAEDAQPLVDGRVAEDWGEPPAQTSIAVFDQFAPALGEAFQDARSSSRDLYGFVEHEVTTTYLGSSTGLRLRHAQPSGHVGITGKSDHGASSAWVGQATRDFTDVDAAALTTELGRRLGWAQRRVDLTAGRYETILPPTAVADLTIYAYWMMSARAADDGQTVYSKPGGGTRVGETLSANGLTLRSDPNHPGMECAPFVVAHASSDTSSVFDNGLAITPTTWIDNGTLSALATSRYSAKATGLPIAPPVGNFVIDVPGGRGTVDDLVRDTERGLLLTCLWYIREVDPQTLLLTGLTRDGVYLVEDGQVVGQVNNFRFNESPIDLIGRFTEAGTTVPAFSREWGDYFPRVAAPALRVPDFNYSSVSAAS